MRDSRWQRVEEIFHQAVELAPEACSAFLDQVCAGDEPLRREVESLLANACGPSLRCSRSMVRPGVDHARRGEYNATMEKENQ